MVNTITARAVPAGEALVAASRQFWLASLGAAVVTREWAQNEAGQVFRTLVREGTAVESRTFRLVGEALESSFAKANSLWHRGRNTVTHTVKEYAEAATTLVRATLPRNLPKVELPEALQRPARGRRAAKGSKARAGRTAKVAKRAVKRTAKGGTKRA